MRGREFDDAAFGQRLRLLRIALGLSEEQVAAIAGRSVETWCQYEATGKGHITRALLNLAKHYPHTINFEWLICSDDGPPLHKRPRRGISKRSAV